MSINYHYEFRFPSVAEAEGAFFFSPCPAPLRPWLRYPSSMLIPQKRQGCVRGASDQMSFYAFAIYCFNKFIFGRQTRQPIFQHYTHARMRARARAVFFIFILTLYFEFLKKCPDQADAPNAGANVGLTQWPFWADGGLPQADADHNKGRFFI
jgi:hypothetical protein